ncbi:MAG: alpha-beta hydrolase superfamily lysophospholipase [Chlamydiales bacterium]|jgi:alpha-beta hydrolase superfamily lysophospholipase
MLLTLTLAVCPALSTVAAPALPRPVSIVVTRGESPGESVNFRTEDKIELSAAYYAPRQKKGGKAPAALLVHDAGSDRGELDTVASYLQKKGFGVLAVDLRGHGASADGDCRWPDLDEAGREKMWSFASRDVKAAAAFLRDRSEIHASNLSVIGIGAGCGLAVRHAIDDENTRAVVLVCPKVENYGFNLTRGIVDLEGLPTLIIVPQDKREVASRLMNAGHEANGNDSIELAVVKADPIELITESRTRKETADWLSKQVMPSKR